jgi:hypothetical protein
MVYEFRQQRWRRKTEACEFAIGTGLIISGQCAISMRICRATFKLTPLNGLSVFINHPVFIPK